MPSLAQHSNEECFCINSWCLGQALGQPSLNFLTRGKIWTRWNFTQASWSHISLLKHLGAVCWALQGRDPVGSGCRWMLGDSREHLLSSNSVWPLPNTAMPSMLPPPREAREVPTLQKKLCVKALIFFPACMLSQITRKEIIPLPGRTLQLHVLFSHSLQVWDSWCQKPKLTLQCQEGETAQPCSTLIFSSCPLPQGRTAIHLLCPFHTRISLPSVSQLHIILPTYIWFGWNKWGAVGRERSKVHSSNSDLCLLGLGQRAARPTVLPFIFFFIFNQLGLYLYWAKENKTMVTLDSASTQQTQFQSANREAAKCFKREKWLHEAWVRFHLVCLCFHKDAENNNKTGWEREILCSSIKMGGYNLLALSFCLILRKVHFFFFTYSLREKKINCLLGNNVRHLPVKIGKGHHFWRSNEF